MTKFCHTNILRVVSPAVIREKWNHVNNPTTEEIIAQNAYVKKINPPTVRLSGA
jgi:hypothetical protein